MADYIDRANFCENICLCDSKSCEKEKCTIWDAPAEDVVPVVHVKWYKVGKTHVACSVCKIGRNIKSQIAWESLPKLRRKDGR